MLITFAAITANPKAFKQLAAGTNAVIYSGFYLLVGDGFTDTYIHGGVSPKGKMLCK
jgi:hypothetical protein